MAKTGIYPNFMGQTEEAFEFYRQVSDTAFITPFQRMNEIPAHPGQQPLPDHEGNLIIHVE